MRGLKNKIVVISGGLGDLGYASAIRLIEEGCKVAIFDLQKDEDKATEIGAHYWQVDISKEDMVEEAFAAVEEEIGPAHILVNTAAYFLFKGVEATAADWQKINEVNI